MRSLLFSLSAVLFTAFWSQEAAAHEVRPAIGDLTVAEGTATLSVTLNAEALLAGADLEGVEDTNALDASDEIDALRALAPEALADRLRADAERIEERLGIAVDGNPLPLALTEIAPGAVGNVDLPRDTQLTFTGPVPSDAQALTVLWPSEWGMLVLRQQGVEAPYTGYLSGGETSEEIAIAGGGEQTGWEAFLTYIPVGFAHIVPMGLDHILFVLGLFFLSPRIRPLLWQVTAFTAAHTVTLALGALGIVNLPGSVVEPLIAASIVFVAVENIFSKGVSPWRPVIIFGFGLLHGLGFASVLGEFGLPEGQFIPALLGFNVGVEVGQIFVILVAFLIVWAALRVDALRMKVEPSLAIYGVLTLLFLGLALGLDAIGFAALAGASAPIFFLPLAALSALCLLSCLKVDVLDSYRVFVAIPASLAIAAVGSWWVIERVFL